MLYTLSCFQQYGMVAAITVLVGLSSLAISHRQFGTLLRGWDAQFYFAQAQSLFLFRNPDLTDAIAFDFGSRQNRGGEKRRAFAKRTQSPLGAFYLLSSLPSMSIG
jgi:hypothetical protein